MSHPEPRSGTETWLHRQKLPRAVGRLSPCLSPILELKSSSTLPTPNVTGSDVAGVVLAYITRIGLAIA